MITSDDACSPQRTSGARTSEHAEALSAAPPQRHRRRWSARAHAPQPRTSHLLAALRRSCPPAATSSCYHSPRSTSGATWSDSISALAAGRRSWHSGSASSNQQQSQGHCSHISSYLLPPPAFLRLARNVPLRAACNPPLAAKILLLSRFRSPLDLVVTTAAVGPASLPVAQPFAVVVRCVIAYGPVRGRMNATTLKILQQRLPATGCWRRGLRRGPSSPNDGRMRAHIPGST